MLKLQQVLMASAFSLFATLNAGNAFATAASNNATVQPGGPRAGGFGQSFFNVEGGSAGAFASYGVVDFSLAADPGVLVDGLSLELTEANAAFTAPGALQFFAVTDDTTSITAGSSPLVFDAGSLPDGLGGQLSTRYLLGTGTFNSSGNVNNGQIDTYSFALTGAAQAFVTGIVNAGGVLRLAVTPGDTAVAATFAGFSNADPQLLDLQISPVPEPGGSSLLLSGLIVVGLLMRRTVRTV